MTVTSRLHTLHTRHRSRRRNTTPKRVKYQVVDGDGGGVALEGQNPRTAARSLRCSRGGFGGVPSTPKPEMSRTGGLPASYWGSGALLGEFHQGFSPWVPLRCPSGALVDDLHPGMNFILADGFRASFVPPVARCPLRNSLSLMSPRPSLLTHRAD